MRSKAEQPTESQTGVKKMKKMVKVKGEGRKALFDSFKGRQPVEVNIRLDHVVDPYSMLDYFDKFLPAECLIVGMKVKFIQCEYPEKARVREACHEEREERLQRLYEQWEKEEAEIKQKRHDAAVKAKQKGGAN
jgi:hypothetical protein